MTRFRRAHPLPALVASAALLLAACGGPASNAEAGTTSVVAAFYPLQFVAQQVGGDTVSVTSLTEPGIEPHDLELTAAQVAAIAEADLVLYIKGFQPAVDEAVDQQAGDRAIDVTAGLTRLGNDPHVWLNPKNLASIGQAVADRLSLIDPSSATTIATNEAALASSMKALDSDYRDGLASCRFTDLVVSHEAFGYLAAAYGLTQVGISGLSPEAEPSPARMKDVANLVSSTGITTIYYETLVDPKVAQTIADETGATAAVLDPLEGLVAGSTADYVVLMRQNLETLRTGQDCT